MAKDTSWEKSSKWYNVHMKELGGYNHRELVLPNLLNLLKLKKNDRLLDLGCGQGFLARAIDPKTSYLGLDSSKSLIANAKDMDSNPSHRYKVHDVTSLIATKETFTHAVFVLSLQNISKADLALKAASKVLEKGAQLVIVLNHPCFRIPKHSSWGFLDNHEGQYRRLDRYYSSFKSTLQTHPSKGSKSPTTLSFHRPLSEYIKYLKQAGFYLDDMREICSNKKSYGKAAKAENFARKEFPLFLMLSAIKKNSL